MYHCAVSLLAYIMGLGTTLDVLLCTTLVLSVSGQSVVLCAL